MPSFVAKVKNVLSGDSIVLVPSKTNQFPPPERLLTLSNVKPIDEFQSKEYVRNLLIGKEIRFTVENKVNNREFGDVSSPIFESLIEYLLQEGIVKLRDNSHDQNEELVKLKQIENNSKNKELGLWNDEKKGKYSNGSLTEEIIVESQTSPIRLIVDKVINGDRIVGTLVDGVKYIQSTFLLAGLKCPRTDDTSSIAQNVAQQAKKFVEDKLLTTKVELTTTIIGENQSGLPLVLINHPSGNNIVEKELELGYGEIVDWQSSLIGSKMMSQLRKAEQTAKGLGRGILGSETAVNKPVSTIKGLKPGMTIENVSIGKVISADTLIIRLKDDKEYTVQLASVRAPKPNDTTLTTDHQLQQAIVATSKELVRQQIIAKTGTVYIDAFRSENKDLNLESRFLISFKYNNGKEDLSEYLVKNGLATVIKHNKATSSERSINWDKLIELEDVAKNNKKGIYGDLNKLIIVGSRIIDASENLTKSKTFFNGFKQKGRISGYHVDFIPNATRFKLFNPKEGTKLTLILGGLSNAKSDQSEEATALMNKKYLQKNIEFEIYDMDKLGGFIGNIFMNSNSLQPIQVGLVESGLAKLHDYAINSNPFANELITAEDSAKESHKGLWKNYDPSQLQNATNENQLNQLNLETQKPEFFDIEVVDINQNGVISFHKLDTKTQQSFKIFKSSFQEFHKKPVSATINSDSPYNLTKLPKKNDLVSAKFNEDGKYYRAKVLNYDKTTSKFEVKHLDFGNIDKVNIKSLRALPERFNTKNYPAFAHTSVLQNLKLPPSHPTDYLSDAIYALEELLYDKKLVINATPTAQEGIEYQSIIYDSEKSLIDPDYTINKQIVKDGWAIVDASKNDKYINELKQLQSTAKSNHLGCWEFGDISVEDDVLYNL